MIDIPKLAKADYQNLLAILHRVEAKGLAEMHEIVALGAKLKNRVETWVEGELHGLPQTPGLPKPPGVAVVQPPPTNDKQ